MTSRLTEVSVDARDPRRLAEFWAAVLGYRVIDEQDGLVEIGSWEPTADAYRVGPQPPTIVFARVPEGKTVKNRLHLDVSPIDATRDAEVDRLIALGARRADVGQGEQSWVVLADPEGNEFCVLRSLAG
jgi:catechol 2,3-dioxygenase-like lactoylglutathione lyase family enzyme